MRLIDADKLDKEGYVLQRTYQKDEKTMVHEVKRLKDVPSIDAVPVIRCKDCKYKVETEDGEYNPEDIVCSYWESDGLEADDYCSYGERKES